MDNLRKKSDKELAKMEKRIAEIYKEAEKDIKEKWDAYMERAAEKLKPLEEAYEAAKASGDKDLIKETGKALGLKKQSVTYQDKYYRDMVKATSEKITHANEIAVAYANGQMPKIYAMNYNGTLTDIKADAKKAGAIGVRFDMVDEGTVRELMKKDKSLVPQRKIDIPKDEKWNMKAINSQVLQGIIQGESIPKISKRLQNVTNMDKESSIRNARTMCTASENNGRLSATKDAEEQGLVYEKTWMATHDDRTRASHAELDGETVGLDEEFSNGLQYPADPSGEPEEVYNCRCTLIRKLVGFRKPNGEINEVEDINEYNPTYFDNKEQYDDTSKEEQKAEETKEEVDSDAKEDTITEQINDYGITFDYLTNNKKSHVVQMQYIPTQETIEKYETIGIRAVPREQEGKYKIGSVLPESYDWDYEKDISTYYTTGETLGGSSCLLVKIEDDEPLDVSIQKALQGTYEYEGKDIFIVGGKFINEGEDTNEVIIGNATAIGKIGIYDASEKMPKLSELKIEISEPEKSTLKEVKQNIESVKAEDIKEKAQTISEKSKEELFEEFKEEMILKYSNANPAFIFGELNAEEKKKWKSLK